MNWFWFAIIALLCWSGSDFFSKIGCRDNRDKYSQFKMVMAVGVVMGVHAAYEIFIGGVEISWQVIWTYLPVSLLYIGSMTLGYVGLRYIELSISSPICNSSGALVAIATIIILAREFAISAFRQIAATKNFVMAADWWGKIKTNLQIFSFGSLILLSYYYANNYSGTGILVFEIINWVLLGLAVLLTIISGANYLIKNRNVLKSNSDEK